MVRGTVALHVPPPVVLLRVMVCPSHILKLPVDEVIGFGKGFTVAVRVT
jgi:hypothetical protein